MNDVPVALITGGSRGIGKAVAIKLAKLGYRLTLVAKTVAHLEKTAAEITQQFSLKREQQPLIFAIDVGDKTQVEKTVAAILEQTQHIDVLFNGAGILLPHTSEISQEDFAKLLNINVMGTFNFIHAVVPHMKNQHSGYIFNVASYAGKIGLPRAGAYSTSKFAVVGFNEALSKELAPFHIRVTVLCPSFVNTDMVKDAEFPAKEMIQPDDIGETIDYLLKLSPNAYVREVTILCRLRIEQGV